MSIAERKHIYERIERLRGCPVISYVTSTRQNAQGQMATDAIPEIQDQLLSLPKDCKQIDLFVVSLGGDPMVAWRIMSLVRDRAKKVGVLIPQAAFSAATLLALGADEIVMHPCGNLGPVDPQIQVKRKSPSGPGSEVMRFGAEDLAGFLNYVRENVGLSDQEYLRSTFEMFCKEVGAIPIGVAARASRLSVALGTKLLRMHMRDEASKQKAVAIAETLNKEFFHHGYPVGRREAKEIGLKIVEPKEDLESAMWDLWNDIEEDLECRHPFNPMSIITDAQGTADLFGPVPLVQLPANLPPSMAQKAMQEVLAQISVVNIPAIEYNLKQAVVESSRAASMFVSRGKLLARRDWEARVSLNNVVISSCWIENDTPAEETTQEGESL